MDTAQFFGEAPIHKILCKLAPPVMLAQLIQALYNIVDSLFVGRFSQSGLTALSIIYPLQLLMIALAVGTGVGINTVMAAKLGVGEKEKAEQYAGVGTPLALAMWLIFAVFIVAALLIQLGVLVLGFAKPGGGTASMVVAPTEEETAASGLVRNEDFYNGTAATEDADSGSPLEKMVFTTGLADAKNITFDIDYGAVTVVVDSGAAEPTLSCTNLRQDWFTFTNTGDNTSPVRVSYKVPANYNLGKEPGPEPEFVLSVPDANTFHFKRLSITAAMGDAEFDNSNTIAADSIDLDLAMGNFTGSTVQAEQFTANISMGDFDLGLLAGVETAKVEAAMGDIGLTVDGRPDDYALDLQTSMGNVMFNGRTMSSTYTQTAAAPRSVTLTAPMGDVVLTTTQ